MKKRIFILNKILIIISLIFFVSCSSLNQLTRKDLLKQSTIENLNKFGSFLWSKRNNEIIINNGNLKIIKNKTRIHNKEYIKSLYIYTTFIANHPTKINDLTFEQRSKLLANLIYYGDKILISKNIKDSSDFIINNIFNDESLIYYNEFEKSNYYELPDLKTNYNRELKKNKTIKKMNSPNPRVIIKASD
ncbi:hypothetical protein SL053_002157 [Flavobacterium psychrophilum]|nr:hypothetical protein [Flavobacterium psychrophilum]